LNNALAWISHHPEQVRIKAQSECEFETFVRHKQRRDRSLERHIPVIAVFLKNRPTLGGCPKEIANALEFLIPKPSPFVLERFGGNSDGAYLVPYEPLENVVACFSPGVRNSKRFEDELLARVGIKSHLLDASSDLELFDTPLIAEFQTFEKKWLGNESSSTETTLTDWVERREPCSTDDLLLQMDIEGAEWPILSLTPTETLERFSVIVLELHKLDEILANPDLFKQRAGKAFKNLGDLFTTIHAHPNNCCGVSKSLFGSGMKVPRTLEVTLIRKDILKGFEETGELISPELPHPLDIWRNVPGKPPIFLGREWRTAKANMRTIVRIAVQRLSYLFLWSWKPYVPIGLYKFYKRTHFRPKIVVKEYSDRGNSFPQGERPRRMAQDQF